jgi:ribosome biogenesis GTPase A
MEINNSDMHQITTSYIPNTTLDFIRLKISDDLLVIDSPGFIIPSINDINIIKKNNIKTFIKPKTFQMKESEVLMLENMFIRFSKNTSVTLYMSNELLTKKYFKEVGNGTKLDVSSNSDLIINGLGFINIKKECQIELINIPVDIIELRSSIFGENNE